MWCSLPVEDLYRFQLNQRPSHGIIILFCSLYRITELLSRIKYGNRGIFYCMTFSVVDQLIKIVMIFFQAKLIWVGAGSGLGLGLGLE